MVASVSGIPGPCRRDPENDHDCHIMLFDDLEPHCARPAPKHSPWESGG